MDIIFDIDGTLWNTTEVVAKAWNRAVKDSGLREFTDLCITADMLKKEFGKPMDVIADDLFGDIDPGVKAELLKCCCKYEHEEIEACNGDLTYPHMSETVKELSLKHNLFIVSNCQDGYIELVMDKTGIREYIRDFECFGHTGLQKDENIALVVKRNGLKNPVYLGDTAGDKAASDKARVPFVFASYGFGTVDSYDYCIKEFRDLLNLFV